MVKFQLGFLSFMLLVLNGPVVLAQEASDVLPENGSVETEQEGRRLGNLPNDQIRQFQMRRACEEDLPECLPEIREIMERDRRNRNWMAFGICSVLIILAVLALREGKKKKLRLKHEMAEHHALGERIKNKWRYKRDDP